MADTLSTAELANLPAEFKAWAQQNNIDLSELSRDEVTRAQRAFTAASPQTKTVGADGKPISDDLAALVANAQALTGANSKDSLLGRGVVTASPWLASDKRIVVNNYIDDDMTFKVGGTGGMTPSSGLVSEDGGKRQMGSAGLFGDLSATGSYLDYATGRVKDLLVKVAGGKEENYDTTFKTAAELAAHLTWKTGRTVSVEDVLAGKEGNLAGLLEDKLAGSYTGPRTSTSVNNFNNTTKSVSLTNKGEASRIVDAALRGALGRRATDAEKAQFLKALNQQERANPTLNTTTGTTTSTTTTTPNGHDSSSVSSSSTDSSSVTKGGFDPLDFSERYARAQEGYAEYQAATTYMDAFSMALNRRAQERLV